MDYSYENTCEYCGQPFDAERSTKRYCSNSCRQLAYLDRRSRQSAQASFIEEAEYESIPTVIPEAVQQEIVETLPPIEVESEPEESNSHKTRSSYTHPKSKRRSKLSSTTKKPFTIDGNVAILGAVAGILVYNYFNKPKATNQTIEPDHNTEKQIINPLSELKNWENPAATINKTRDVTTQPGENTTKFQGLPSFESLKWPDLGKSVDNSNKSDALP